MWSTAQCETIYQLAMANSVHWYSYVLTRALDFEAGCQSYKGETMVVLLTYTKIIQCFH